MPWPCKSLVREAMIEYSRTPSAVTRSSDGTSTVLEAQKQRLPLTVYSHKINQGLGATIGDGLRMAAKVAADDDVVVTMDSDETHSPDLIARMVRMIEEGRDVVIASRYQPGARVTRGERTGRRHASVKLQWRLNCKGAGRKPNVQRFRVARNKRPLSSSPPKRCRIECRRLLEFHPES
jgi:glycosyltransferase involved in cell wall biosynthesis